MTIQQEPTFSLEADFIYPLQAPTSNEKLASQAKKRCQLAEISLANLHEGLNDSPNNPTYLQSPGYLSANSWLNTHEGSISDQLTIDFDNLDFQWAYADRMRLENLHRQPKKHVADKYAYAYSGISKIIDELSRARNDPELPTSTIDKLSVRAISATIVRMHYLRELAARDTAVRQILGNNPFRNTFNQNLLSTIRYASRHLIQQHVDVQPANIHPLPNQSPQPALPELMVVQKQVEAT